MPALIYKDSLGRCEPPSMLYDTIRKPHSPYIPPKSTNDVQKDTLESVQQQLNRKTVERLQNGGLRLPHESYVAVVQSGKYLFLAIMFPPYFCCYGLPRWLLISLLPQLLMLVKQESLRVGRFIQNFAKRVTDIMKGILEQMLASSLTLSKYFNKSLGRFFISAVLKFTALLKKGIEQGQSFKKRAFIVFRQVSILWYTKAQSVLSLIKAYLPTKVRRFGNQIKKFILKRYQSLNKVLFKAFQLFLPVVQLVDFTRKYLRKITNVASRIKQRAKRKINFINKATQKCFNHIVKITEESIKVLSPLIKWGHEKLVPIQASLQSAWKLLLKRIQRFNNSIYTKANALIAMNSRLSAQFLRWILPAFKKVKEQWNRVRLSSRRILVQQRKKWPFFDQYVKSVGSRVVLNFRKLLNINKVLNNWIKQAISWLWLLLQNVLRWLHNQLAAFPNHVGKTAIRLSQLLNQLFCIVILGMRLSIAWTWAILVCGMRVLHEFSEEIDDHLYGKE